MKEAGVFETREGFWGVGNVAEKFQDMEKWISPQHGKFHASYEELGSFSNHKILPGYYAGLFNVGHSTFFIDWKDGFNPNASKNVFRAVGGNQGIDRVTVNEYSVGTRLGDKPSIWWQPMPEVDETFYRHGGFGRTRD
ncbi:MAG: hypothetical protein M5R36_14240 [Deltaproteobacteria bacterium]|nr:hypothetical protein [Deltaproteobacteria bacterium]